MTTKDKEILELAEVFGVGCQIQCQECPVTARFKTERPEDDELCGVPGPCFIIEDGKCFDCVDYIRATAVYDAGYRKQSEGEWIRKDGFFVCSVCDTTKPFAVLNDNIHYFAGNYCHKCGAKMKGGAE